MPLVFRLSQRNNLRQSSTVGDRKKILVLLVLWEVMRPGDFFLFLSEDGGGGGEGIMQRNYAKEGSIPYGDSDIFCVPRSSHS